MEQEFKDLIYLGLFVLGMVIFVTILVSFMSKNNYNYINKPFGICVENYTQELGMFKCCGGCFSKDNAKVGLWSIFIGLPLIVFVILPLLIKIKKGKKTSHNPHTLKGINKEK